MKQTLLSLLLVTFLLMPHAPTYGQSSQNFNDDEAKQIAALLAELEGRRKQVAALEAALGAQDAHVKALETLIADQERIITLWKTAAEARHEANDSDSAIKASFAASVASYEKELQRTRDERDSARRQRWAFALGGVVLGVLAVLASRSN